VFGGEINICSNGLLKGDNGKEDMRKEEEGDEELKEKGK
jgi:hypothetical protein